jgi:HKD family nuclease
MLGRRLRMIILSNINSNHYNHIKNLLVDADEIHIVSPFLMESFDVFFHEIKSLTIQRIVLTTTLKDNDPDLFKKADSLHSFCKNCKENGIDYRVHIDNKLHGKIYIALKNDEPFRGIITSANFTEAGLGQNHEWGVQIDDTTHLKQLLNDVSTVRSEALTEEEIGNIIKTIDNYSKYYQHNDPKLDLQVNHLIKQKVLQRKSDKRFFIKPVGWAENPFSLHRTLSSDVEKLHFAKRPAAVTIGDILICYGVGTTKLLGYFEVIDEPLFLGEKGGRWPWEIQAKNLSPDYSEAWNDFDNTISSIQATYNSDFTVTYVGGKTLGALNFGADKIQLTEEFAQHAIRTIEESILKATQV